MTLIYVDTNIFLDALQGRKSLTGKDIDEYATKFFYRSISCEFKIVVSSWTLQEVYKQADFEETRMLLELLKKKIISITHTEDDIKKAKEISEHFQDALHGLLAVKAKADFVVTRDLPGFDCVKNLIKTKLPENV